MYSGKFNFSEKIISYRHNQPENCLRTLYVAAFVQQSRLISQHLGWPLGLFASDGSTV